MWKVYQDKTVHHDGYANDFAACIASLLEIPLRDIYQGPADDTKNRYGHWNAWLFQKGYCLEFYEMDDTPPGFSIVRGYGGLIYPQHHAKAGRRILQTYLAFDGKIIHDPYPIAIDSLELHYWFKLVPLKPSETLSVKFKHPS